MLARTSVTTFSRAIGGRSGAAPTPEFAALPASILLALSLGLARNAVALGLCYLSVICLIVTACPPPHFDAHVHVAVRSLGFVLDGLRNVAHRVYLRSPICRLLQDQLRRVRAKLET